jgi:serine/threonine protein kinase
MVSLWMSGGTLRDFMESPEYQPEKHRSSIVSTMLHHAVTYMLQFMTSLPQLKDVANGLYYLHREDITHGDIKDVSSLRS